VRVTRERPAPALRRGREGTARALLLGGGVVVALGIAEVAVRLLAPAAPRPRITEPAGVSPFERTDKGLYVYRPGASFSHVYDVGADHRRYFGSDGRVSYRINNLGFRGADVAMEKPPAVRRVLCVGDSFTFGEGVHEQDTWPHRLGRLLGGGTQVLNAGVQGYDFDHEALFLLLHGRRLRPDVVVIAFFMNDVMPFGETVEHHALLTESPEELSRFARLSALWRLLERRRVAARQTRRYLEDLRASFAGERWREARRRIGTLREMADHDGFRIVAMIFPILYDFDDYPLERERAEARGAFEQAGIEVVDLLDSYRSHPAADLWAHPVDPHPNELAHGIAAQQLARLLR
jgi:hypothetical protein